MSRRAWRRSWMWYRRLQTRYSAGYTLDRSRRGDRRVCHTCHAPDIWQLLSIEQHPASLNCGRRDHRYGSLDRRGDLREFTRVYHPCNRGVTHRCCAIQWRIAPGQLGCLDSKDRHPHAAGPDTRFRPDSRSSQTLASIRCRYGSRLHLHRGPGRLRRAPLGSGNGTACCCVSST